MKRPIIRRLMYAGFVILRATIQQLPLRWARGVGGVAGRLAFLVLRGQRRLASRHLQDAFGEELSEAQRRQITQQMFTNLGTTACEWFLLPRLSLRDVQQLVVAEGVEHVQQALARGHGVIVASAHLGNWELIHLYLKSLGYEGGVVARRLRYPEYESFLVGMRAAKGVKTLVRGSMKEVVALLRTNHIIGVVPDQDVDSLDGVFVNFFGRPAYTPVGPAALSLMTGAPLLPCVIVREGARFRLIIESPVTVPVTVPRTQALTEMTQAWSDVIASYIRRYPDQWVWMHRRWKTQPLDTAQASQLKAVDSSFQPPTSTLQQRMHALQPAFLLLLFTIHCSLFTVVAGCAKSKSPAVERTTTSGASSDNSTHQMSEFALTGYAQDGSKRWILEGKGASIDGQLVMIHHPDGVGFDPTRTAYLTASAAQVNQTNRHVRLEHDVTIHTSDGLWMTTPVLHWIPDENQVATDQSVRFETDHMLLRGRGLSAFTQMKQATVLEDVEAVFNPSDHQTPAEDVKQVSITCDGPLTFDYDHHIATFERNVHVRDARGDLYSDKLVTYLNQVSHTIRYAEAIGHVRMQQQQNNAMSERAIYEPAIGKITLVGQPSLLLYPDAGDGGVPQTLFGGLAAAPIPPTAGETMNASSNTQPASRAPHATTTN